jgi:prepilin-type N-terminal cleavage/methylation domain-containing protein
VPEDCAPADAKGFTFVEIVVAALVAGIFAAIVVFSVASVTHHRPDPACTNEARRVQLAIDEYKVRNNNTNPASLPDLVTTHLLPSVPTPSTPSGSAGFTYDPDTGTYAGSCPSR